MISLSANCDRQCITRDNVSISVDAVVYWRIVDLEKSYYKVQNLQLAMVNLVLEALHFLMAQNYIDMGTKIGTSGSSKVMFMDPRILAATVENIRSIVGEVANGVG